MTQARTPGGATSEYLVDATQVPGTITQKAVPNSANRLHNVDEIEFDLNDSNSAAEAAVHVAKSNGRVQGILANAIGATTATAGWLVKVNNESNSDSLLASFGFGTDTEAASANDKAGNSTAGSVVRLANTLASTVGFSAGDVLTVDVTYDSGCGALHGVIYLQYDADAR